MNLLFCSNGSLTPVYSSIAKHLQRQGHNIFWFVTEDKWYQSLLKSFNKDSILMVTKELEYSNSKPPEISIPLNEIVFTDRELKAWRSVDSLEYIKNLHHNVKDFLLANQINCGFSESTWAHEIMVSMLCDLDNAVECAHYSPTSLRIPDNRFTFFADFLLSEPALRPNVSRKCESDFLESRSDIKVQDDLIAGQRASKAVWMQKLYSFVVSQNFDKGSPTCWGARRKTRFFRNIKQLFNAFTYKFVARLNREQITRLAAESTLYVYALHKEPETSITNKGRYYENQMTCIINIWRKLPANTVLLIKEHRVAVGDRGYFFFQKLIRMGSIRVVDETVESDFILEKCAVCFTISGTMAYEFALRQKPAFTFAKVFFNKLKYCSELSLSELRKGDDMDSIIARLIYHKPGLSNDDYASWLRSSSYSGRIDDVTTLPEVMSDLNIFNLCRAFTELLDTHVLR